MKKQDVKKLKIIFQYFSKFKNIEKCDFGQNMFKSKILKDNKMKIEIKLIKTFVSVDADLRYHFINYQNNYNC